MLSRENIAWREGGGSDPFLMHTLIFSFSFSVEGKLLIIVADWDSFILLPSFASLGGFPSGGVAELGGATTSMGEWAEGEFSVPELISPMSKFKTDGGASDLRGLAEVEEADDLLASLLEGNAVGVPKTWPTLFLLSLSPELMVTEPVTVVLVTDNEEGVVGLEEEEWLLLLSGEPMKEEAEAAEGMGCTEETFMFP